MTRRTPLEALKDNPNSLRKAINAYCYLCSGEDRKEVTLCPVKSCVLWPFRPYQPKDKNDVNNQEDDYDE